jgi:DNA-directed RNA polymerase specialized sigma subunit
MLGLAKHALDDTNCFSDRDHLIFKLHFFDDMSAAQIALCRGIGLSKPGIERVLRRVKDRIRTLAEAGPSAVATQRLALIPVPSRL